MILRKQHWTQVGRLSTHCLCAVGFLSMLVFCLGLLVALPLLLEIKCEPLPFTHIIMHKQVEQNPQQEAATLQRKNNASKKQSKGTIQSKQGKKGPIQAKQQPVNKSNPAPRTIDPFAVVSNPALEAYEGKMAADYRFSVSEKEIMSESLQRHTSEPARKTPQGAIQFQQIATIMGEQHGVDTSNLKATHNSSFPETVNAEATIQGNKIDFAPGKDSEYNMKHEVAHFIDNAKNGTPSGDKVVNGQKVDTTRENVADHIAGGALQRKARGLVNALIKPVETTFDVLQLKTYHRGEEENAEKINAVISNDGVRINGNIKDRLKGSDEVIKAEGELCYEKNKYIDEGGNYHDGANIAYQTSTFKATPKGSGLGTIMAYEIANDLVQSRIRYFQPDRLKSEDGIGFMKAFLNRTVLKEQDLVDWIEGREGRTCWGIICDFISSKFKSKPEERKNALDQEEDEEARSLIEKSPNHFPIPAYEVIDYTQQLREKLINKHKWQIKD